MTTDPHEYEPWTGPHTNMGHAVANLRSALKLLGHWPVTPAELGEAFVNVRWALDNLCSADLDGMQRWLDEEHCARCGEPSVAVLDNRGAPYCASCWPREVEHQRELDADDADTRAYLERPTQFTETDREGGA